MAVSIDKAPDARRPPVASVIISTYNWPEALYICLDSYRNQDIRDFEIVVADDGSRPETDDLIAQLSFKLFTLAGIVAQQTQCER